MKRKPILLVCQAVPLFLYKDKLWFDRKFYDGIKSFVQFWPGNIKLAMRTFELKNLPSFGSVEYVEGREDFDLIILRPEEKISEMHLYVIDLLMISADNHIDLYLSSLAKKMGIPCIPNIEYTLKTRIQMAIQERTNNFALFKSLAWLFLNEFKLRYAIWNATAIQANGAAAFKAYGKKENSILYFDNRVSSETCIKNSIFVARLEYLAKKMPLRLAFSGRLIKAKGADALVDFSVKLRETGTSFEFHIFGSGELEQSMREDVVAKNLGNCVYIHGAVDFERELLPFIQNKTDLFICCHRQGDPSCTYLETYGCGVPIAGFSNEAHSGILERRDVGWMVQMNSVSELAILIARLSSDRKEIDVKSKNAINFARENLFEHIFQKRMNHCFQFLIE